MPDPLCYTIAGAMTHRDRARTTRGAAMSL